jgi:serine/threonine-protein phosphatase 6 regulatory ankyrin repeat subunit B
MKPALFAAIESQNLERIAYVLSRSGTNVEEEYDLNNGNILRPIHYAGFYAAHYAPDVVDMLAKAGADINSRAKVRTLNKNYETIYVESETALYIAVSDNSLRTAEALLRNGANPDLLDQDRTPLCLAVAIRSHEMVNLLVRYKASLGSVGPGCITSPLQQATIRGFAELLYTLVQLGADPKEVDKDGLTLMELAKAKGKLASIAMLKLLADKNHDSAAKIADFFNKTQASNGFFGFWQELDPFAQSLFDLGYPNFPVTNNGRTALHWAALAWFPSSIESFLAQGCDIDAKDDGGRTPLMCAAVGSDNKEYSEWKNQIPTMRLLLNANSNMEEIDSTGKTALLLAIEWNNFEAATFLCREGANVNVENPYGVVPLSIAAKENNPKFLSELLHAGADINHRDKDGKTVMELPNLQSEVEAVLLAWIEKEQLSSPTITALGRDTSSPIEPTPKKNTTL